jgi:murein DD-endopeptidase MepM/ murein hydrolase activator NlpD
MTFSSVILSEAKDLVKSFHLIIVCSLAAVSCRSGRDLPADEVRSEARTSQGLLFSQAKMIWPVRGRITSTFGNRGGRRHEGVDIKAPAGHPILAAAAGRVEFAGWKNGYGKVVIVRHSNFKTVYGHCSSLDVSRGDWVELGEEIASVGATGNASGYHLHFEYRDLNDKPYDPLLFLGQSGDDRVAHR